VSKTTKQYDVIVIGSGAAGLMCAFTAAKRGLNVLVLEKSNKVGKKILMSGGGRCNFTNHFVEADNYISGNPHFCKSALSRYTQWDFISMVEQYNIDYEERSHSQLFCLHSAKDILNMLLDECEHSGVEIKTHCDIGEVEALAHKGHSGKHQEEDQRSLFRIDYTQNHNKLSIQCRSLVVASGGLSIPTLGGSGIGYNLAKQFDIALTERRAGLVPFMFSDATKSICERLSGLALAVEVSCNSQTFNENLLFTHRGISGPAILQISNYWFPGNEVVINLLPGIGAQQWLVDEKVKSGKLLLKNLLHFKLAKPLVLELQQLWWPDAATKPLAEFTDKQLREIGQKLNNWIMKPSATEGYRTAEVTLGGVNTNELSSKTMEAKQHKGLFFVGEILDVSGHLGGFNFQWAWSSGFCAGSYVSCV